MAKSRDAFRTISEVAEWLDTPAHVLRFWESKFSQIKPVKRAGGRRYYRPDDMALLAGIKTLLHDQGLTIKGAQKLLREQGVKHVAALGADPRQKQTDADADKTEDAEIIEAVAEPAPEPLAERPPEDAPEPQRVDPAAWDPDDPWPADPVPQTAEPEPAPVQPELAFDSESAPEPEPEAPEPEPAPTETAEAEPDTQVALPFVRARRKPEPPEDEDSNVLPFVRADLPAPPPLPDVDAITGRPGTLSRLARADRSRLDAQRAEIAPLAARLSALAERMDRAAQ